MLKKLCAAYVLNREKQVILLMVLTKKDGIILWSKLPALFRGKTSKYHGDFHCFNCLHFYNRKQT